MYGIDKPPRGSPTIFQILALAAATILVLGLRRPDQFRHPYLWVEDATVLQAYVERGLASIFEPVMGYYILPSKILDLAAFKLSILHAPAIALVLTALFTVAVVIAIAFSPTHLRWPCACAMTPLLVPTDPEIFAVGLYAFWWSGLLLVVALLWDSKRDRQWLRATYLVLGGLSTPIIVPVSGLLVVRAALDRQKCEFVASVIALIAAAVQLLSLGMDVTHKVSMQSEYSTFGISLLAFTKFMSWFFMPSSSLYVAIIILLFITTTIWLARHKLNRYFSILIALYVLIIVFITVRVYPEIPIVDPFLAGPRYFFYPFVLLSWILIWLAASFGTVLRGVTLASMAIGVILAGPRLARYHDAVDWSRQILSCTAADRYDVRVHYTGDERQMWVLPLTGQQCRNLMAVSLLD